MKLGAHAQTHRAWVGTPFLLGQPHLVENYRGKEREKDLFNCYVVSIQYD